MQRRALEHMDEDSLVATFVSATNIGDTELAREILSATDWDVERAIATFVEGDASHAGPPPPSRPPPRPAPQRRRGRESPPSNSLYDDDDEDEDIGAHDEVAGTRYRDDPAASETAEAGGSGSGSGAGGSGVLATLSSLPGAGVVSYVWNLGKRVVFGLGSLLAWPFSGGSRPAHVSFRQFFDDQYGRRHPIFFEGPFTDALRRAQREQRLVLVYMHSENHVNTPAFCRETLAYEALIEFVNANFVFWAGDVSTADAYTLSTSLVVSTFPALAVCTVHNQSVNVIKRHEGPLSGDAMLEMLSSLVEEQEAVVAAHHAESHQRNERQMLQAEQEEAYARAVAQDMQRRRAEEQAARERQERAEREAREAREAAERAEAERRSKEEAKSRRQSERELRAQRLPPEPPIGAGTAVVRVRLLDGSRLERRFSAADPVQAIYDYVDVHAKYEISFELVTPPPNPKVLDVAQSVEQAGLMPRVQLMVREILSDAEDGN